MRKLALALYSIYFWTATFAWMLFIVAGSALLSIFLPYSTVHVWFAGAGFSYCIPIGFNRLRIRYHPEFDGARLSVFAQNHVNLLDAFVAIAAIPHAFCGVMHSWQFRIPVYGWMMALSKGIKVEPGSKNLSSMLVQARERFHQRISILVFPEGGRTLDGQVKAFRKGVFIMARDAGYPVVPIAVRGMFAINRKGSNLFRPGRTVDVFVGKQYETAGLSDEEIARLAAKVQAIVAGFVATGDAGVATMERPQLSSIAATTNVDASQ